VRALLLLHGFTGAPESWAGVRAGVRGAELLAPALLGHDGTPGRPEVGSFDDEVDRLAAEVGRAGLEHPHVVGYSLGGRLALGLLVRHARLFSGATLIGVHPGLDDPRERGERRTADEAWARLLEREGIRAFVDAWEEQPLFASQRELPAGVREAQRLRRRGHNPEGLARSLRILGTVAMPGLRAALGGIRVPVRLLAGERDGKFSGLAREMEGALPRGCATIVPGAGHNLLLERPAVLAETLLEGIAA